MSTTITLSLPDDTYRRAEQLADLAGRPVNDVLADTLNISLPALDTEPRTVAHVSEMSDSETLALASSQMDIEADRIFRDLLSKQQAGTIRDDERPELFALMQLYQTGLLRKAQALREAVHRGLLEPLES
jgi:hypothetical protein